MLKYPNETTTPVSNVLLSFNVLPIIFVLYSKNFLVVVLLFILLLPALLSLALSFTSSL